MASLKSRLVLSVLLLAESALPFWILLLRFRLLIDALNSKTAHGHPEGIGRALTPKWDLTVLKQRHFIEIGPKSFLLLPLPKKELDATLLRRSCIHLYIDYAEVSSRVESMEARSKAATAKHLQFFVCAFSTFVIKFCIAEPEANQFLDRSGHGWESRAQRFKA